MTRPRVFLDSGVLIEGLVSPWSAARGVLILGRAALFTFVVAEIVVEETERALVRKLAQGYGGAARLRDDFRLLMKRLRVERVQHVSRARFEAARRLIRHVNDVPVLAAAMVARPDWLVTGNTKHFTVTVARRTGLRIVTPAAVGSRPLLVIFWWPGFNDPEGVATDASGNVMADFGNDRVQKFSCR